MRDIVEDLGTRPAPESKIDADVAVAEHTPPPAPAPALRIYCLPARADRDELAGGMRTCFASKVFIRKMRRLNSLRATW